MSDYSKQNEPMRTGSDRSQESRLDPIESHDKQFSGNEESSFLPIDSHDRIVLALNSRDCFAFPSNQIQPERLKSKHKIAFDLEKLLPVDAEDIAICKCALNRTGFLRPSRRKQSEPQVSEPTIRNSEIDDPPNRIDHKLSHKQLIIACHRSKVQRIVESLESSGKWIASITPMLILALQELLEDTTLPDDLLIAWKSPSQGWDFLEVSNRRPTCWLWVSEVEILQHLQVDQSHQNKRFVLILGHTLNAHSAHSESPPASAEIPINKEIAPDNREIFGNLDLRPSIVQTELADTASRKVVQGNLVPWVDLRGYNLPTRAPLYPVAKAISGCLLATSLALAVLTTTLSWRTMLSNQSLTSSESQQVALFRELFPKAAVPTDIAGRLQSEKRKLIADLSKLKELPPISSSLPTLVQFINSLPEEGTFRIDSIAAKGETLSSIDGASKDLKDFELLVSSLRAAGYQFASPNVKQMKDGFSVHLEKLVRTAPVASKSQSPSKASNKNVDSVSSAPGGDK